VEPRNGRPKRTPGVGRPLAFLAALSVALAAPPAALARPAGQQPMSLERVAIAVDPAEPSYIQYGARDLAGYLTALGGHQVAVRTKAEAPASGETVIAVGERMVTAYGGAALDGLGPEGFLFETRTRGKGTGTLLLVAGQTPRGTNAGLATLLPLVKFGRGAPYLDGPPDRRETPSIAVRGIHLNGWPLNYPYAFRSWKEDDWKRFVDIAWAQRINLLYLWPFMEIVPLPMSPEDEAYLQEVRRVVDYAQSQRGMEVWIMQSANRIGVSDCGSPDPRLRTYWVIGTCQQDMNPADPEQVARIMAHFEAFYRIVNNADGFCMIDSDPGGWPGSPLSDQARIFNGARQLLDRYNVHGKATKLIDWMWLGWGRHPTGSDSGKRAVEFMQETIRNFRANLAEPWELISGLSPYLESAKAESSLDRTVYLQYGAIEMEPAFPATNLGLKSVREVFDTVERYPGLKGVMGNNELMLLQLPRTFYFFETAWHLPSKTRTEADVLGDLAGRLYPDQASLIARAYEQLRADDAVSIRETADALTAIIDRRDPGRTGALGRFLFPDRTTLFGVLKAQLEIRAARQSLIQALRGTPSPTESAALVERYFDALLAWNRETGWDEMIDITIWRTPIYEEGPDLTEAMTRLRKVIAQGKPYAGYTSIDGFFTPIAARLRQKYAADSVMVGCIEPFKLALIQGW
jgi:hypothetical protein